MEYKPRDYQKRAYEFLMSQPRAALWAEMGLGKTVSTLTAASSLLWMGEVTKALVVAPLRVAKFTWPAEVAKWDHLNHLRLSLVVGTAAERKAALEADADIYVINFENIPWLLKLLGAEWPFDLVVIDESAKLKSHKSVRFKGKAERRDEDEHGNVIKITPAEKGLKHYAGRTKYWINLTGSPTPKGLHDLWSQTFLLDGGKRLGENITAFRNRWFQAKNNGFGRDYEPLYFAQGQITEAVKDLCLTLKAADYFDLPPTLHNRVPVDLDQDSWDAYNELAREFVLTLEQEGVEIVANNAGVLTGKLRQFTAGALYTEDGDWVEVHDAKIKALQDVVDEACGMPVLVIYNFQSDLARLTKAFPQGRALDKNPDTLIAWNNGEIPMIFVHPQSAGHGLNMQTGSNIACFFSLDWDLDGHDQVAARISAVRQVQSGHPRPVFIHYLMVPGTIDELILQRLIERRTVQDILMEAMKR